MKEEINAGVKFLKEFLAKYGRLSSDQIEKFGSKLTVLLEERYSNHWYESQPMKGQAFRCLRLKRADNYVDPVLEQILRECSINLGSLGLPNDFTLWIDPGEVSVRFGDQIGYTYTIARIELRPNKSLSENKNSECSPILLLNTPEKIFDEKLTAFIRQNSTAANLADIDSQSTTLGKQNNKVCLTNENKACDDEKQVANAIASLSIDEPLAGPVICSDSKSICSLPAEVNKPASVVSRRINSSNISICSKSVNCNYNKENENGEMNITNQNRQSYNDSCYYSSSSSSCASSYEADGPLNWMKNSNFFNIDCQKSQLIPEMKSELEDKNNKLATFKPIGSIHNQSILSTLFPVTSVSNPNNISTSRSMDMFSTSPGNNIQQPKNKDSLIPLEMVDPFVDTLYPMVAPDSSIVSNCFAQILPRENSSNHFDTPNSSITSSTCSAPISYFPSARSSSILTNDDNLHSNSTFQDEIIFRSDNNDSLDQQVATTSSIIESSSFSPSKSPKTNQELNKNKSTRKKKKEKSDRTTMITMNESSESTSKKDETYCGYVESFPYYYKLNRLYNALAVQKIQTERLKKSGVINQKTMLTANMSTPGSTPTGSRPGSSLSSKIEIASSPVGGISDFSPQSLKQNSLSPILSSSLQNANSRFNSFHQTSPAKQNYISHGNFRYVHGSKEMLTTTNAPTKTNMSKNGYPMTPINAAISFANHHHTKQLVESNKINQNKNNYQIDQQLQQMTPLNNYLSNFESIENNLSLQQSYPPQPSFSLNIQTQSSRNNDKQDSLSIHELLESSD